MGLERAMCIMLSALCLGGGGEPLEVLKSMEQHRFTLKQNTQQQHGKWAGREKLTRVDQLGD